MLNNYFKGVRQRCWELIDVKYPEPRTKYDYTLDLVRKSVDELSEKDRVVVFDAGCGHKSKIDFHDNAKVIFIGADMVLDDVKENTDINFGFKGDLNYIPLKDNSVDVIFSNMVLEHLFEPELFFREASRVLTKGGVLIFSTPCIYNVVVVINRLLPDFLSEKLGTLLTGEAEDDIFPTAYKANSIKQIRELAKDTSFTEKDLLMYQPPPYAFVFSTIVCRLMIGYYKLINKYDSLKFLRGVIIARYQKN